MADPIRVSGPVSGTDKTLSFETGKLAPQSQGAVVATIGGTTVLTTANAAHDVRPGMDFFPLTVDVEERSYAIGKIPGSFFRREGRPSEDAILTCRLTDRPLRPSFPKGFRNETQIVTNVLGADHQQPYDVLSINAASAALMISGIPFDGPIGAVRIAYSQSGEWIAHPTYEESNEGTFELVVAGRELDNGDVAVMMVEAGGTEKSFEYYATGAKVVDEAVLASGLDACKVWIKESIGLQRQLVASVIATNGPITPLEFKAVLDYGDDVFAAVERVATDGLSKAVTITGKAERNVATDEVKDAAIAELAGTSDAPGEFAGREKEIKEAIRSLTKKLVRNRVVEQGVRMDGRGPTDLRPVSAEVGLLPTAHGSGLFQRGETQVLDVATLAMPRMNQLVDTLNPETTKRFLHHYNMPPWANGETGRVGSPKRREIGHGALAGRAILPVLPNQEEFAYTLRLVSEVLSSNGSTSMGSVCASSLSLMDAGVPIKAPVAGIAMGLIYADGKYLTLTDILGCRGRVRRHGLQGRRHRRRHHGAAARHEDRRHPRRRADRRARPGQGGPAADPRGHERRARRRLATRSPRRRRRSPRSTSRSTRSARSSGPRARSSTRSSPRPAPTSASTTTAPRASSPSAPSRRGGWKRPRPPSSPSSTRRRPSSARSTTAGS